MPDNVIRLPIQVPTLPEGFCSTLGVNWPQQLLNAFGQSVALLSSGSGAGTILLNQEGLPDADQRGFLWFRPSAGLIFKWDSGGGAWTSPNRSPASGEERRLYEGVEANVWSYDGGDGTNPVTNPPATNAGAMWQVDINYNGRSPMGPGTIPGSDPSKILALSENFGEGSHLQTVAEMPAHTHGPKTDEADGILGHAIAGAPATYNVLGGGDTISSPTTGSTGGGAAMNNTHPVRGIYLIRRTSRQNYVAS